MKTKQRERKRNIRKVHYAHYDHCVNDPYPVIRIGGRYLQRYGFMIGCKIDIAFEQGKITIRKVEDDGK